MAKKKGGGKKPAVKQKATVKKTVPGKKAAKPAKKGKPAKAPKVAKGRKGRGAAAGTAAALDLVPQSGDVKLGPIVLPEPDAAVGVLRELAELNDRALVAHGRFLRLKEDAKTAKEKWEQLAEEVQRKLRISTHAADLPLLSLAEREADQSKMEAAAKKKDPEPVAADAPSTTSADDPPF